VKATDKDQGQNAELVYSLVSAPNGGVGIDPGPFEIDPSTGVIRVRQSVDREQQSDYRFSVRVVDLGGSGLESTAAVRVTVIDVNDEAPQFRSSIYSVGIDENLPAGSEVAVLEASDNDVPPFDRFTFDLLPGGSLSDAFRLDKTSGTLLTTRALDREEQEVRRRIVIICSCFALVD
jgi:Cadherin domain